jgi:UDP-N-acetylglucosamine 2-epimerase (non-hydrolysing)
MVKVLSIIGTRPEAIKMAPVIKTLEKNPLIINKVCCTTQHKEMLEPILKVFDIRPEYNLNIMKYDQSLEDTTSKVVVEMGKIIKYEKPDWILVQGDTTTAMVSALAGYYNKTKVAHIEAGLRTGDLMQPYPEEANRRIIDILTELNFAPTDHTKQNLLKEGIEEKKIFVTGNTVVDALSIILESMNDASLTIKELIKEDVERSKKIILVTAHRRENFGKPLIDIAWALREIACEFEDEIKIIYPVHLNPNVRKVIFPILGKIKNIKLIEPLNYIDLIYLMSKSYLILTDSGGLQEEAPSLNKPLLILRNVTERPEGVKAGVTKLIGTLRENVKNEVKELLKNKDLYNSMTGKKNPYGDGQSSKRIVEILLNNSPDSQFVENLQRLNANLRPEVSIILPTYNGSVFLEKSISSCLNQTFKNLEVIVVNDGSNLNSVDFIVNKFNDSRLIYLKHDRNKGLPAALNTGFKHARGEFLTWTSDDNYYKNSAIQKMMDFLKNDNGCDLVYTDFYYVGEENNVIKAFSVPPPSHLEYGSYVWGFLFRRKVYDELGDYNNRYFLVEDYEYWLRAYNKFVIKVLHEPLYYYRTHEKSLSDKYGWRLVKWLTDDARKNILLKSGKVSISRKGEICMTAVINSYFMRDIKQARRYLLPALVFYPICLTKRDMISVTSDLIFGKNNMDMLRDIKRKSLSLIHSGIR